MKFFNTAVIALLFVISCNAQSMHEGDKAPDILLPNSKGDSIALSSIKNKKYILIDFWASWCGPCRKAMPGLKKLYSKYKDKGLEVYSISLDENTAAWKRAIFEDGTSWLQFNDRQGNTANAWGVSFIPYSFLLDENKKIIAINAEAKDLDRQLEKLLR